jgi:hypothetical protein
MTDPAGDRVAERVARWLAARITRRSFLGRLGRGAMLVASGSVVATLLSEDPAAARVCGQSGVAPKCPTYDCDETWGWCWYATGCCANGGLKKICDCCAPIDFVHGYCPSGTNVLCIVESCGNDPRVQTAPTTRLQLDDPVALSAAASRARHGPGSQPDVVLAPIDPLWAGVAAPYAAGRRAALLLTSGTALAAATVAELQRLGTRRAALFGAPLSGALADQLGRYGIESEVVHASGDVVEVARDVATERARAGSNRAFCVEAGGVSAMAAPLAGAAAAAMGHPLLIGTASARAHGAVLTYLVGPEAAANAASVPGGHPLRTAALDQLSAEVAEAAAVGNGDISSVGLLPGDRPALAAGLLSFGAPILLHGPAQLGVLRDWMFARRDRFRRVVVAGTAGALDTNGYYEVQSLVNAFEAHLLIGVDGQGLPVIEQPNQERPLGLARIASRGGEADDPPAYWTGRVYHDGDS